MKSMRVWFGMSVLLAASAQAWAVDNHLKLLEQYGTEAGEALDAERGKALWEKSVGDMSCTNCHTSDVTQPGKMKILFFFTKSIDPMALSANPDRFQDIEKTDKAFEKNCKRVFDRLCTPKEKGDILKYLTSQ